MFRFVPLSLVGLPAVLLSACGGGGGNEVQSAVVPGVALAASADHFSQDVSSMTGKFTMKFTIGGTSVEMQGNYSFEAPNRGYLTMDIFGQELEMLMLPPDFYVYLPDQRWYQVDSNAWGNVNLNKFEKYADSRGPIDYAATAKGMKGVSQLPDDAIDGKPYLHYGGDVDFSALADEVSECNVDPGDLENAKQTVNAVRVDAWVDKDTYLPRRLNMVVSEKPDNGPEVRLDFSMDFLQYSQPVDIPAAPSNAHPLSGLTGGQSAAACQ